MKRWPLARLKQTWAISIRVHKCAVWKQTVCNQFYGHAYLSTGVKKHFMFLEELNRTICENGLNFRLLCVYFFKNISQLPGHLIKHNILCLNSGFLAFIQWLWPLFQGSLPPLMFFPAATLAVYHFLVNINEKNIVLTQHSINVHIKPLSEKQRLSEPWGGLVWCKLFLESAQH